MRAVRLASVAAVVVLSSSGNAAAQLLPPLPPPPTPPDLTGTLPTDTVDELLGTLNPPPPGGGGGGTGGGGSGAGGGSADGGSSAGTTGTAGGTTAGATNGSTSAGTPDTRAPRVKVKVLSKFAWVARTGRLKARVTSDEQGVVAIGGTLRPGPGIRRHGRVLRVRRKLVRLRPNVVGYRAAGTAPVTIRVPKAAVRELARARNLRLSLTAVAVDPARNQATTAFKRTLTRPRKVAHLRRAPLSTSTTPVHNRG